VWGVCGGASGVVGLALGVRFAGGFFVGFFFLFFGCVLCVVAFALRSFSIRPFAGILMCEMTGGVRSYVPGCLSLVRSSPFKIKLLILSAPPSYGTFSVEINRGGLPSLKISEVLSAWAI